MEASIGRDDRLVTVEEEFKYAFKYINTKKKIWRKIVFKEEIIGDADKVEIPRLLIQPLVENSVYHGIEKLRGKVRLY